MNICLMCGAIFSEPRVIKETHGLDYPPYEEIKVSPCCNGEYTYTEKCIFCEEYVTEEYAETPGGWICSECYTLKSI